MNFSSNGSYFDTKDHEKSNLQWKRKNEKDKEKIRNSNPLITKVTKMSYSVVKSSFNES